MLVNIFSSFMVKYHFFLKYLFGKLCFGLYLYLFFQMINVSPEDIGLSVGSKRKPLVIYALVSF